MVESYMQTDQVIVSCQPDVDEMCVNFPLSASAVLERNPPLYFERNLKTIIGIANIHGIEVLFSTWAYNANIQDDPNGMNTNFRQEAVKQHNSVISDIARAYDVHLVDLAAQFPDDSELWLDGVHLTEEGALQQAEFYAKYMLDNIFSETR